MIHKTLIICGITCLAAVVVALSLLLPVPSWLNTLSTAVLLCGVVVIVSDNYRLSTKAADEIALAELANAESPITDEVSSEGVATQDELNQLFIAMACVLQLECDLLATELVRAEQLISSGASGMNEAFYRLQALTDEQQQKIEQLSGTSGHDHSDKIDLFAQQLKSSQGCAIQSLQFEDITTQSLQSMLENTSQLQEVAAQLQRMVDSSDSFAHQVNTLTSVCNSVTHQGLQPSNHRTVAQQNMDEGAVELF